MPMHVKKGDVVEVIAGDHRGARGKVLRVDPDRCLVVVEGVNMVFRHVRPTRKNPQGGRLQKEAPIHASNVLPYDSGAGRAKRTRFQVERDGAGHVIRKRRLTQTGTVLHELKKTRSAG